jgi:7-cyano-7-deazaguanine synthase
LKNSKALVLVSGGIESSVLLAGALERYDSVTPVYIHNHLRWEAVEIFWLKRFLRYLKSPSLQPLQILDLTMRDVYESHWSITGTQVPGPRSRDASVYLPGRNILFLSKAAVFAALHGISSMEIGILKANPFSDSSPTFLSKMAQVLSLGLGASLEIKAPFSKLKKSEIIAKAGSLALDLTFSCFNPKGYDHCGDCNKCTERKKAFFAAGIFDKTHYKKAGI